ncbi:VOC family protein [Actinomadura hibisca]|uniref:VOC family protein n=1 Tax=Actinomadura hibisca TaxID=68565 RepID=UPI00082E3154|nr:VOC family protein [Actinomadura hibisca]
MTITLNHTIVPAPDGDAAARFFADVLGLEYTGPHPHARHFTPVKVNGDLTLDFMTAPDATGVHLAFETDPATFDTALTRLRERDAAYGDAPNAPANGRVDEAHPLGARGVYFADEGGNLYELFCR